MVDAGALIRRRRGGEDPLPDFFAMSSDPLWKRLRNFNWEGAGISDKEAKKVQKLLQDLAGKKEARAMRASQNLWSLMKANAVVTPIICSFLQEIRKISDVAVRSEIDELLELELWERDQRLGCLGFDNVVGSSS